MKLALKTATYGILHISVATILAYLLTGNIALALGLGLIEPIVQTGVFALHERIWEGKFVNRPWASIRQLDFLIPRQAG